MEFEHYTVALLVSGSNAPALTHEERGALQDAHLGYLAELHAAGDLLAVGPLTDPDGELRGFSIFRDDPRRTQELTEDDPAVRAGVFDVRILPWAVPAGAIHFTPTFLPRSRADVLGA